MKAKSIFILIGAGVLLYYFMPQFLGNFLTIAILATILYFVVKLLFGMVNDRK